MSSTVDNRDPVVTVRMPEELLADLERLRPLLQQLPEYRGETLTRSMLVRLAVAHGLERLRTVLKERVDDEMQIDLLESRQSSLLGDRYSASGELGADKKGQWPSSERSTTVLESSHI